MSEQGGLPYREPLPVWETSEGLHPGHPVWASRIADAMQAAGAIAGLETWGIGSNPTDRGMSSSQRALRRTQPVSSQEEAPTTPEGDPFEDFSDPALEGYALALKRNIFSTPINSDAAKKRSMELLRELALVQQAQVRRRGKIYTSSTYRPPAAEEDAGGQRPGFVLQDRREGAYEPTAETNQVIDEATEVLQSDPRGNIVPTDVLERVLSALRRL